MTPPPQIQPAVAQGAALPESPCALTEGVRAALNADIAQQFASMEYRPTVVAAIVGEAGTILLVRSGKNADWVGLVQGGVDQGEDVIRALIRECAEEIGVSVAEDQIIGFIRVHNRQIPRLRDGFSIGKRYYSFLIRHDPSQLVRLQPSEISASQWVFPCDISYAMRNTHSEKRADTIATLAEALELVPAA